MKQIVRELLKIAKELIASGKPINRDTAFFKSLKSIGVRSGRVTYIKRKVYYQWDSLHGEWEIYDKNGKHIGVADEKGNPKDEAIKGRFINL